LSFLPHVRLRHGAGVPAALVRTPVWLVDDATEAPHREVLVNLGPDMVPGWETFTRVVEVVQADDADRLSGRERWRLYGQAGTVELKHHVAGVEA
ncbi:MAG: DNA polymerase III subunit chi, partial [Aquincola sp.]|nr:DNA polymerase III subunit chi [Aquincola sp.]